MGEILTILCGKKKEKRRKKEGKKKEKRREKVRSSVPDLGARLRHMRMEKKPKKTVPDLLR